MSERTRDVAVGLTVIVALVMLAAMIVVFTGTPGLLQRGYKLRVLFDSTHDAQVGDPVRMSGIRVGSITDVRFTNGDPRQGVTFTVLIQHGTQIPSNCVAYVQSRGFVGSASIDLRPEGPLRVDPDTGQPMPFMPVDQLNRIEGRTSQNGGGIIPPEITDAVKDMQRGFQQLGELAGNLNKLLAPTAQTTQGAASGPTSAPANPLAKMVETLDKLGRTLDDLHATVGDAENQENLRKSLSGFANAAEAMRVFAAEAQTAARNASQTATSAGKDLDKLTASLVDSAEKVSQLTETLNRAATKMEAGGGTLGSLLNDPKLYNNLAEASVEMTKLVRELRELAQKWQTGGMEVKLR